VVGAANGIQVSAHPDSKPCHRFTVGIPLVRVAQVAYIVIQGMPGSGTASCEEAMAISEVMLPVPSVLAETRVLPFEQELLAAIDQPEVRLDFCPDVVVRGDRPARMLNGRGPR
jgi:hypothetical protein